MKLKKSSPNVGVEGPRVSVVRRAATPIKRGLSRVTRVTSRVTTSLAFPNRTGSKDEIRKSVKQRSFLRNRSHDVKKTSHDEPANKNSPLLYASKNSYSSISGVKLAFPLCSSSEISGDYGELPLLESFSSDQSSDSLLKLISDASFLNKFPADSQLGSKLNNELSYKSAVSSVSAPRPDLTGKVFTLNLEKGSISSISDNSSVSFELNSPYMLGRSEDLMNIGFISQQDKDSLSYYRKARNAESNLENLPDIFRDIERLSQKKPPEQNLSKKGAQSAKRKNYINVKIIENFNKMINGRKNKKTELKHVECVIVPPPPPMTREESGDSSSLDTTFSTQLMMNSQNAILIFPPFFELPAKSVSDDEEEEEIFYEDGKETKQPLGSEPKSQLRSGNSNVLPSSVSSDCVSCNSDSSDSYENQNLIVNRSNSENLMFHLVLRICPMVWQLVDDPCSAAKRGDLDAIKYFATLGNNFYDNECWARSLCNASEYGHSSEGGIEVVKYIVSLMEDQDLLDKIELDECICLTKSEGIKDFLCSIREETYQIAQKTLYQIDKVI